MAATTRTRDVRGELVWRLSGQARIDRFMTAHRSLHMTLSGALLSLVMAVQGLVLMPGGPEPVAPFTGILERALPLTIWGLFAIAVGMSQFMGYALAWLGFVHPHRIARLITSSLTLSYFTCVGTALLLGGYSFGPITYLVLAVPLALRDLNEAMRMQP